MSNTRSIAEKLDGFSEVPLQPTSLDIWQQKYALKDTEGKLLDADIEAGYERVARAIADVETGTDLREQWYRKFLWALRQGAVPAGRILSNAGAAEHRANTSTINCTVSGAIEDSMESILNMNTEAGLTLKAGCGIGYEFSTLRPRGAPVSGAGARTSGPLSFMEIFDKTCLTVSSAGGRRGAQMATFDVRHPDVLEFIRAKREDGHLRQFNLSLLITDEFIQAVQDDAQWDLRFPPEDPEATVYRTLPARYIWQEIMTSTYEFAEPGFVLIDRVNDMNNNWFCESIRATNPCGEQPLPGYGACLLGSLNLARFVNRPFTAEASFDWQRFTEVAAVFTRMLDNVVEINGLPLQAQRDELLNKRRHGMGFFGLGSAMALLGMKYGSSESVSFTERMTRELAISGWKTGLALAREKGMAPSLEQEYEISAAMLDRRPEMADDGISVGDRVPGRLLHARYSRYMQRLASVEPELVEQLATEGCRFTHHSSVAPTGTIALSLGNNASNGIEPSFAHEYSRNIITEGKKSKVKTRVFSYELLAYREMVNPEASPQAEDEANRLPDYFVTTDDIAPEQHLLIQAAAQKWIDSSISKTINVPTDFPYEEFKDIYLQAYQKGLKGCTTFRFNPEQFQGVLVREDDIANTIYRFTLADGSVVQARGDEEIVYDGETHTAANLYDALKEGYYGKL
jgi:ribonucleoside-diphosphate reductase alpha chain